MKTEKEQFEGMAVLMLINASLTADGLHPAAEVWKQNCGSQAQEMRDHLIGPFLVGNSRGLLELSEKGKAVIERAMNAAKDTPKCNSSDNARQMQIIQKLASNSTLSIQVPGERFRVRIGKGVLYTQADYVISEAIKSDPVSFLKFVFEWLKDQEDEAFRDEILEMKKRGSTIRDQRLNLAAETL